MTGLKTLVGQPKVLLDEKKTLKCATEVSKKVFHIISYEPINERPTSKSFHEPSMLSVRMTVIGTYWQATTRELNCKLKSNWFHCKVKMGQDN